MPYETCYINKEYKETLLTALCFHIHVVLFNSVISLIALYFLMAKLRLTVVPWRVLIIPPVHVETLGHTQVHQAQTDTLTINAILTINS